MASSSAWDRARSLLHPRQVEHRRRRRGWPVVLAAHAATSSHICEREPAHAAMPTRSWLSWVVIMRQPSFSSPTRCSTGTRTSV